MACMLPGDAGDVSKRHGRDGDSCHRKLVRSQVHERGVRQGQVDKPLDKWRSETRISVGLMGRQASVQHRGAGAVFISWPVALPNTQKNLGIAVKRRRC